MARPALKATDADRNIVESMARHGIPHRQIAAIVCGGIDLNTLKKHFKRELTQGKAFANYLVGRALFEKACSGDVTAAIFWAKTQMGWCAVNRDVVQPHYPTITLTSV